MAESNYILRTVATDGSRDDLVNLGPEYVLPRRFDAWTESTDPTRPVVHIWWEVIDGQPVCVRVDVRPGLARHLTTADLRVPLARYLREAIQSIALNSETNQLVHVRDDLGNAADQIAALDRRAAKVKPSRGVPVKESDLRRTADLWHEAPATKWSRSQYIMDNMCISKATAERYVRRAREAGFIPPRG